MSESQNDRLARKIEASKQRAAKDAAAPVGGSVYKDAQGRYFTRIKILPPPYGSYPCGCYNGWRCPKCRPAP